MVAHLRSVLAALALGETAERVITAFEASVIARAGEPKGTLDWLLSAGTNVSPIRTWYEFDSVMFATGIANLVSHQADDALKIAQMWNDRASLEGRRPAVCRAALLAALAFWQQGRRHDSMAEMQRAISLAIPGRIFAPFLEHLASPNSEIEALLRETFAHSETDSLQFLEDLQHVAAGQPDTRDSLRRLSGREYEVLDALCRHESNKLIGRSLGISEHAVKFHLKNIFRKLGVHTRAEAMARHAEVRNGRN
jgi:LuxR family maltose regulon positive regulatory protein